VQNKKLSTRMMLRVQKFYTGHRTLTSTSTSALTNSQNEKVEERTGEQENQFMQSQSIVNTSGEREHIENDNIWKVRIWKRGYTRLALRLRKLYKLIDFALMLWQRKDYPPRAKWEAIRLRRELKYTELAQLRDDEEQRQLNKLLHPQVKIAERTIINTLANLGYKNDNKNAKNRTVVFDLVEFDSNVFRFHVDAKRLPSGVDLTSLASPQVTTTLAGSLWKPVNAILGDPLKQVEGAKSAYMGLWYEVEIAGTLGIPNRCDFRQMLELIPESANSLSFTLGLAESKRNVVRSLEPLPHLLITGETLGGKSNGLNVIICCHISRNTPDQLRTLMIDVKGGGIELGHYEGIKHMILDVPDINNGIARTPEQGLKVLNYVAHISEKRMDDMTARKIKKLSEWNRRFPKRKMPYIVVYIDEVAELLDPQDRKMRNAVLGLIRKLASTSRAAGVHLIGALQTADRTNMPQTVKNNFPGRLAFAMADASASILAVGDGSATNLSPVGRAIWKHGRDRLMVQTPYIASGEIAQIVENAKEGKITARIRRAKVTPEEIIRWGLEEMESRLPSKIVRDQFNNRGASFAEIEQMLIGMEGNIYQIDDQSYRVIASAGKNSRIIEKLDEGQDVSEFPYGTAHGTSEMGELETIVEFMEDRDIDAEMAESEQE